MTLRTVGGYLNSPRFLRKFHGVATIVFGVAVIAIPVSSLAESVRFLVAISVYALFVGHWSSWQAARVEVKQDEVTVNAEKADVHAETVEVEAP